MRIELLPHSKKYLMDYCDRLGMTQVATMTRLVEWLSSQPEDMQATLLNNEGPVPEVATAHIKSLAGTAKKKR